MPAKRKAPVSATDDTWERGDPRSLVGSQVEVVTAIPESGPRSLVGAQVEVVSAIPESDVCTLRLRLPNGEHCYLSAVGSVLFLTVKSERMPPA